jgi:hypothetical protein
MMMSLRSFIHGESLCVYKGRKDPQAFLDPSCTYEVPGFSHLLFVLPKESEHSPASANPRFQILQANAEIMMDECGRLLLIEESVFGFYYQQCLRACSDLRLRMGRGYRLQSRS